MSSTPPAPADPGSPTPVASDLPPPPRRNDWLPSRRGLVLIALALVVGLVLFAVVWRQQSRHDFYTVEPVARPADDRAFDPLPAPRPADRERAASGLGERDADDRDRDRDRDRDPDERTAEVERAPQPIAPPPPAAPPAPTPPPAATDAPVPVHMPPPRYPRRALQRGIEGTVLVRADVGPDGVPTSVGIVRTSRSRDLDRAALDAVERWRFRPAMANGRPTVGSVVVPIEFSTRR